VDVKLMCARRFSFAHITRFAAARRGMAAVEFAIIAPTLIMMFMGILEMSFRFRAGEEATRYVHQAADLIAREAAQTNASIEVLHEAAVHMMKPLDTADRLDMDVASIGFEKVNNGNGNGNGLGLGLGLGLGNGNNDELEPQAYWRRVIGTPITLNVNDAAGLGQENETVIRVAIRYRYTSPISSLFGGPEMTIEREAWSRPRSVRIITINGLNKHANGNPQYIS
jgi:hypothetical protein